jgi:cell division septal protein FtsQ
LALVVSVPLLAILAGGWLWLRDSALVSVEHVTVTGAQGPDGDAIRFALAAAARRMTTLDMDVGRLRRAVAAYPVVADLRVDARFPHGARIHVIERVPIGTVPADGRVIPFSADGTLLHDVRVSGALPSITGHVDAGGSRVTDPEPRQEVALLAAAPARLLVRVSQVTIDSTHGLSAQLRAGPVIYFGDAGRLAAKWIAAVAVLGDPGSAGAAYIDVTDPARPAAGSGGSGAGGSTGAASSSSTSSATPGTAATLQTAAPDQTSSAQTAATAPTAAATASTGAAATAPTGAAATASTGAAATAPTGAGPTTPTGATATATGAGPVTASGGAGPATKAASGSSGATPTANGGG